MHTEQHKHRTNSDIRASSWIQTHDSSIPVIEREKTVHALDRAATVIGQRHDYQLLLCVWNILISILNTADTTRVFSVPL
jgi:hypothetical protein